MRIRCWRSSRRSADAIILTKASGRKRITGLQHVHHSFRTQTTWEPGCGPATHNVVPGARLRRSRARSLTGKTLSIAMDVCKQRIEFGRRSSPEMCPPIKRALCSKKAPLCAVTDCANGSLCPVSNKRSLCPRSFVLNVTLIGVDGVSSDIRTWA